MENHYQSVGDQIADLIRKQDVRGSREWAIQQLTLAGKPRRSIRNYEIDEVIGRASSVERVTQEALS